MQSHTSTRCRPIFIFAITQKKFGVGDKAPPSPPAAPLRGPRGVCRTQKLLIVNDHSSKNSLIPSNEDRGRKITIIDLNIKE